MARHSFLFILICLLGFHSVQPGYACIENIKKLNPLSINNPLSELGKEPLSSDPQTAARQLIHFTKKLYLYRWINSASIKARIISQLKRSPNMIAQIKEQQGAEVSQVFQKLFGGISISDGATWQQILEPGIRELRPSLVRARSLLQGSAKWIFAVSVLSGVVVIVSSVNTSLSELASWDIRQQSYRVRERLLRDFDEEVEVSPELLSQLRLLFVLEQSSFPTDGQFGRKNFLDAFMPLLWMELMLNYAKENRDQESAEFVFSLLETHAQLRVDILQTDFGELFEQRVDYLFTKYEPENWPEEPVRDSGDSLVGER